MLLKKIPLKKTYRNFSVLAKKPSQNSKKKAQDNDKVHEEN